VLLCQQDTLHTDRQEVPALRSLHFHHLLLLVVQYRTTAVRVVLLE
jgi:hypothetical protein